MNRHLNLIKTDLNSEQKRNLPRFPFSFMSFKLETLKEHVFKVKDISYSGMRIELSIGDHKLNPMQQIKGALNWGGKSVDIGANVVWSNASELGVEFINNPKLKTNIEQFLSIENFVHNLKPLHKPQFGLDIPANLKFWLRSDGPMEIFVWQHTDGELAKIQFILMENFVEWEDGLGIKTGVVKSKKIVEMPLLSEDEYVFTIDTQLDGPKIHFARDVISHVSDEAMPQEAKSFILRKLPIL